MIGKRKGPEGILKTHQLAGGGAKMQWAREVLLNLLLSHFARVHVKY